MVAMKLQINNHAIEIVNVRQLRNSIEIFASIFFKGLVKGRVSTCDSERPHTTLRLQASIP
jgi:hypothetical protein